MVSCMLQVNIHKHKCNYLSIQKDSHTHTHMQTHMHSEHSLFTQTFAQCVQIMATGCLPSGVCSFIVAVSAARARGPSEERPVWRSLSDTLQRQAESRLPSQPEQQCPHLVLNRSYLSWEKAVSLLKLCPLIDVDCVTKTKQCFAVDANEVLASWLINQLCKQFCQHRIVSRRLATCCNIKYSKVTSLPHYPALL